MLGKINKKCNIFISVLKLNCARNKRKQNSALTHKSLGETNQQKSNSLGNNLNSHTPATDAILDIPQTQTAGPWSLSQQ